MLVLKQPVKPGDVWTVDSNTESKTALKGTFKYGEEQITVAGEKEPVKAVTVRCDDLEANGARYSFATYYAKDKGMVKQVIEAGGLKVRHRIGEIRTWAGAEMRQPRQLIHGRALDNQYAARKIPSRSSKLGVRGLTRRMRLTANAFSANGRNWLSFTPVAQGALECRYRARNFSTAATARSAACSVLRPVTSSPRKPAIDAKALRPRRGIVRA